jgi:quercetin dioxygenase-like cupin family protein
MSRQRHVWRAMLSASVILSVAGFARGQGGDAGHAAGQNMVEMKFGMVPGMPTCSTGSVQSGDPTQGPSILLAKAAAGCSVPWHWHAPNEHLMMVSGVARLEMKDGKPITLRAGGFAMMPSRHVHQFLCTSSCVLYVYSDAAYDIHYVDGQGKEISPADALKAVKETAPKETK